MRKLYTRFGRMVRDFIRGDAATTPFDDALFVFRDEQAVATQEQRALREALPLLKGPDKEASFQTIYRAVLGVIEKAVSEGRVVFGAGVPGDPRSWRYEPISRLLTDHGLPPLDTAGATTFRRTDELKETLKRSGVEIELIE